MTTYTHVHVVGAGLAGLAAALRLVDAGVAVTLHEASPAAGGRCRSYHDRELGVRLDNGNHLLLSGNQAAWGLLRRVGTADTMRGPGRPLFPFMDLSSGERWTVAPSPGRVPWWVLDRRRRIPGTRLSEYLSLSRLRRAGPDATVAGTLPHGPLYRKLIEPLTISALNTMPEEGSAQLMGAVVAESLSAGGAACVPSFPRDGLSESFIDPAIAALQDRGATLRLGHRITGLGFRDGRLARLDAPDGPVPLGARDAAVLAVPAPVAAGLLPGTAVPDGFEAILNLHFRAEADGGEAGFVGLVGGLCEWAFAKPGVLSVTVSAANRHRTVPQAELLERAWAELCRVFALSGPIPPHRVVTERRATFAATPAQERRRPPARTAVPNLLLAGDWTATNLPATLEGATRSGNTAADLLLNPEPCPARP